MMQLFTNNPESPFSAYLHETAPLYPEVGSLAVYIPKDLNPDSLVEFAASLPEETSSLVVLVPYPQDHHTALIEQRGEALCRTIGKTFTVLRLPEYVFGEGCCGEAERLFHRVMKGTFVAVRGLPAHRCAICAYDVARATLALATSGGIYELSDYREHTLTQIAEAMSDNAGIHKRTIYIPDKWAPLMAKLGDYILPIGKWLDSKILADMHRDDLPEPLSTPLPFEPFDAVEVLARRQPDYPYKEI